jgi:hypothetical protein
MARQTGLLRISGTLDGITFYQMGGKDYARTRSSLSGRRFREDRVFEGSRRSSRRFGQGNRLAGMAYRSAGCVGDYPLFCALKKLAIGLLKEGLGEDVVLQALQVMLVQESMFSNEKRNLNNTEVKAVFRKPVAVFDHGLFASYRVIKRAIKTKVVFQYKRRRERHKGFVRAVRDG